MNNYEFHDTANAFPFITGEAYESLKKDIEQNGIIEPIYLFEGKIIDGRNRYRVAQDLGLNDIPVREYEGDDPVEFVQSMNLHRRQLTPSQRAAAAAFLADFRPGHHHDDEGYETQTDMAKRLGVSRRMVVEATSLKRNASTELVERVKNGDISLHNATAISRLSPEEQNAIAGGDIGHVKEVAKKIKAMTKGQGRKKKDDPTRIIKLDAVQNFSIQQNKPAIEVLDAEETLNSDMSLFGEQKPEKIERKPRKKKIAITEAGDFGHALIDAIIVLGATAEDADGGKTVIDTALSESQLASFADQYDADELRALLNSGIQMLSVLVK